MTSRKYSSGGWRKPMETRFVYKGKARDLTFKEMWMLWHFGRKIELLEDVDFCWN
jgi:hypothetical protein